MIPDAVEQQFLTFHSPGKTTNLCVTLENNTLMKETLKHTPKYDVFQKVLIIRNVVSAFMAASISSSSFLYSTHGK